MLDASASTSIPADTAMATIGAGGEYCTRSSVNSGSVVVCDAPAAHALWLRSFGALLQGFPAWVRHAVARGFEDGAAPLWRALQEVYAVHGCRAKPFPPELERTLLHVYGEGADRTVQKQE